MKLKLKNTPEQVELIKAMGSRDQAVASEASEAFAAFISPVIQKVLNQAGTSPMIYSDMAYDEDDNPSIPLDLWYDESQGFITVWSQAVGGGLPTSEVTGMKELKISTYRLDSAVSWLKRYARRARLDIVGKALERMSQEVLLKQERNAWAVILKALAEASTNSLKHVIGTSTANVFLPDDLSRLMTRIKRINTAWSGGTPDIMDAKGLTDLFMSPEVMEQIRGFAYNPVNTVGNQSTGPVALPDGARERVWNAAGMSEMYGVNLHELLELGSGNKYNSLFGSLVTSSGETIVGGGNTGTFAAGSDELLVGFDLSRDGFVRPVARQHDSSGTFSVLPDDQFVARAEKMGFYGFLEEGRVCVDARAVVGIVM
tara:strand:+ start:7257 stop:8369 length:1113 start_codon:yes stop_codon:yes gene_type:complete